MAFTIVDGIRYYEIEGTDEAQVGKHNFTYHNACDVCPQNLIIKSHVLIGNVERKVTVIDSGAFQNCEAQTKSVFIPKTIRVIREEALNSVFANEYIFEEG